MVSECLHSPVNVYLLSCRSGCRSLKKLNFCILDVFWVIVSNDAPSCLINRSLCVQSPLASLVSAVQQECWLFTAEPTPPQAGWQQDWSDLYKMSFLQTAEERNSATERKTRMPPQGLSLTTGLPRSQFALNEGHYFILSLPDTLSLAKSTKIKLKSSSSPCLHNLVLQFCGSERHQ